MRATNTFQALCLGATLGLTGCVAVHHDPQAGGYERYGDYENDSDYGPPPHAPAHGYRHHYYGAEHIYDVNVGVYTVVGYPDIWFNDGFYYRHRQGYWERCNRLRGGRWGRADWAYVPKRLHGRYPQHGSDRDRWSNRQDRQEDRHERVDERRSDHDERVDRRHDEHDERQVDRHERVDARRDERVERKVERHERVDARHDQRDERADGRRDERTERKVEHTVERHERVEARHGQRDERKVEHKAERHERVEARHGQRAERKVDRQEQRTERRDDKRERGDYAGPVE